MTLRAKALNVRPSSSSQAMNMPSCGTSACPRAEYRCRKRCRSDEPSRARANAATHARRSAAPGPTHPDYKAHLPEILARRPDGRRAFVHGRGHAARGLVPDVAHREHARQARLELVGPAVEVPLGLAADPEVDVPPGHHVAVVVALEHAGQPVRVRPGAD